MVYLRIKEICSWRGLTVTELSKKVGMTVANLTNIANNKQKPTFANLEKIADALDVEVSDLFAPAGAPKIVCPYCGKSISIIAETTPATTDTRG